MARRELGPASLAVVQAIDAVATAPLLVACSGGADSLALAAGAAIVGRRRNLPVRALVVDHGLQPGSDGVAASVIGQLASQGIQATVARVDVADAGDGPEGDARSARYAALLAVASDPELILLGHTLDDQAETVLLGLARGSGVRSLAGMPAVRGRFVRPLLGLRRATTRKACAESGLVPWDDPHNESAEFTRSRVRHSVLPLLEAELGPGIAEALARTAQLARADADLLDDLAVRLRAGRPTGDVLPPTAAGGEIPGQARDDGGLDAGWLADLPEALRHRVIRDWLVDRGAEDLTAGHVWAVAALVTDWHGQGPLDLPGLRVERRSRALRALRGAG